MLLLRIALIVGAVEAEIMLVPDRLLDLMLGTSPNDVVALALADTLLLTVIGGPLIYLLAVRPFEQERDLARRRLTEEIGKLEEAQKIGRVGAWEFINEGQSVRLSQ